MSFEIPSWLKRIPEIVIGGLALTISGLTLWMCAYTLVEPARPDSSRFTLWSVIAFVAAIAVGLGVLGLRLIIPRLRVEGRHLLSLQGLVAFLFLYGLTMIIGLLSGEGADFRLIGAVSTLIAVTVLIFQRLNARKSQ